MCLRRHTANQRDQQKLVVSGDRPVPAVRHSNEFQHIPQGVVIGWIVNGIGVAYIRPRVNGNSLMEFPFKDSLTEDNFDNAFTVEDSPLDF